MNMDELTQLKAKAYDLIHTIEQAQKELNKINEQIFKLTNDGPTAIHPGPTGSN